MSDPLDVKQCDVALAPFDLAHVRAVNPSQMRKRFLRHVEVKSARADYLTKSSQDFALRSLS